MFDDPQKLAKVFASANAVFRPLLRSPLHRIVSSRLMLLTYTDGKTGNQYAFAIGYPVGWRRCSCVQFGQLAEDSRERPRCAPTDQTQWFTAKPTVIKDAEQKADVLGEFVRRNGAQAAKGLMLGLPGRPPAGSATVARSGSQNDPRPFRARTRR